jgi:hypothetical protein
MLLIRQLYTTNGNLRFIQPPPLPSELDPQDVLDRSLHPDLEDRASWRKLDLRVPEMDGGHL